MSSRQRVTSSPRQRLYPEPAAVIMTAYRPLESRCVRGVGSCGDRKRRRDRRHLVEHVQMVRASPEAGRATATVRGVRSWSSSSVAWTAGSAPKRRRIVRFEEHVGEGDDRHPLVVGHVGLHHLELRALGQPGCGVVDRFVEAVPAERADRRRDAGSCRSRRPDPPWRPGPWHREPRRGPPTRPRFKPRPLTPKFEYWYVRWTSPRVVRRFRDPPGHAALLPVAGSGAAPRAGRLCSSRLPDGASSTRSGIRYSNIDPDHESSADPRPTGVRGRPR